MADEKHNDQELADENLEKVAGGGYGDPPETCPKCGASNWGEYSPPPNLMYKCRQCGALVFVEL